MLSANSSRSVRLPTAPSLVDQIPKPTPRATPAPVAPVQPATPDVDPASPLDPNNPYQQIV